MRTSQPKLLVVDDAEMNRDLLSRRLRQHRYDVLTASDGRAALDLVAIGDVSLVLLDVEMPEMSGIDVLRSAAAAAYRASICRSSW